MGIETVRVDGERAQPSFLWVRCESLRGRRSGKRRYLVLGTP